MSTSTKADRTVPDLANATPGFLLDEIATMRIEMARLKFLDGVYKQALDARLTPDQLEGKEPILGEKYKGQYRHTKQERIDADGARMYVEGVEQLLKDQPELLSKLQLLRDAVFKSSAYKTLNTSPKDA